MTSYYVKSLNHKKSIDKKELKKRSFIDDGILFIDGFEVQGVSVEEKDSKFEIK